MINKTYDTVFRYVYLFYLIYLLPIFETSPIDTTDAEIRDMFAEFGKVELVSVPRNRETGKSRGFAFVDMSSEEELQAAIDALNGTQLAGRTIRVNKSLPKDKVTKKSGNRNEVGTS